MRIPGTPKPEASRPRPEISAPIPGSLRKIVPNRDGSIPANPLPGDTTSRPHNEYPHNRQVPNNLLMRREDGGLNLVRLPQGARLSEPMPMEPARSDSVDVGSLGWPQNNRNTDRLHQLKDAHNQSIIDLNDARLAHPRLTDREKQSLSPLQLRVRKAEIAHEQKASSQQIHLLEKSERQARRNIDVFKSRFSKELTAETDYRQSRPAASHGSMLPGPLAESPVPRTGPRIAPKGPEGARKPSLDSIPERSDSPTHMDLPYGSVASDGRMDSKSSLRPLAQGLEDHREEYRTAKNAYYGMKPEASRHAPEDLKAARDRYKRAEADLSAYRKGNKASMKLEERGHELPPMDELRELLHPRTNDNYPAFPGATGSGSTRPSPSTSGMHTPVEAEGPSSIPMLPHAPMDRPSAPTPDHPRNRRDDQSYGLDYYGI